MKEQTVIRFLEKNINELTEEETILLNRMAKRIKRDKESAVIEDIIERNIVQQRNILLSKAISLEDFSKQISSFEHEIPLKLSEITGEQLYNLVLNEKKRVLNERENLSNILNS